MIRLSAIFCLLLFSSAVFGVDFETDIEPILQKHCFDCHGPDLQESQFRLDRLAPLLAGGNSGEPAVIPGRPEASYLLKLLRHEEPGKEMPPDSDRISPAEIALIERWINDGAKTPKHYGPAKAAVDLSHWSFQPVRRPEGTGIDSFIERRLATDGLSLSSPADRHVLIRRLFLVMLGLPPNPEEVTAFVENDDERAWSQLVEEVLNRPQYGERWATHWLDLVRFGETHGFETNRERPNAWRYRDWVIQSLNEDKPYDQFVREQIVGDKIGADVGTGFLVAGPYDLVKGKDPKLGLVQRMNELDDMINTTGTAFLGLTTGCARCHNHKFDPITQRDYYALQAVFAGVHHGDRELPLSEESQQRLKEVNSTIADLTAQLQKFIPPDQYSALVIDESDAQHSVVPRGQAKAAGDGQRFGDEKYTWWQNVPGETIAAYKPQASGRYRIWISWGAGYETHSTDARYVLRSATGNVEIARVNQQLQVEANATSKPGNAAEWSGLHDAGLHDLQTDDQILLVGGEEGTAVTADTIVLQPVPPADGVQGSSDGGSEQSFVPILRSPVSATKNEETFPPRLARFVRFTITQSSSGEACLDELEIYSGDRNVALASHGSAATSSGDFVHKLHKLEHINDGRHGNEKSWIVDSKEGGWVQIEFAQPERIDRIVWQRDRLGRYSDRLPIGYHIETALKPGEWERLASSADRSAHGTAARSTGTRYRFTSFPQAEANRGRELLAQLQQANQQQRVLNDRPKAYAGTFSQPGATHRLYRGEPEAKREQVNPGAIEAFTSLKLDSDAPEHVRRRALAEWITSDENPLTARVIANRIWQFHFGTGIVDTPSDFGRNGARPSHPELLDWLASELMANNWSLKHLHRVILNSATWRQDNRPNEAAMKIDAGSRLLWRFPPRRLEAEAIRDSILKASGVINLTEGGPGFSPFEIQMENVRHYHAKESFGPADWRRMIYMTKVRQEREHVFGAFDCPDSSMVVPKRSRSTTPLQALNLLNSRFVMQQSKIFAERLQRESSTPKGQVRRAWQLCFQHEPEPRDVADSLAFIETEGLVQFARAMLNSNEFVFLP